MNSAERERLDSIIRETLAGITIVPTKRIAEDVLDHLQEHADAGEAWAQEVIRSRTVEGIRLAVRRVTKSQRGKVKMGDTGQTVLMPTYVGVEVLEPDGTPSYQLGLWWELPWPIFERMVTERRKQHRVLGQELVVFSGVEVLRKLHPDTMTPKEAFEKEGIDPRDFVLGQEEAAAS